MIDIGLSFAASGANARYLLRGLSTIAEDPIGRGLNIKLLRVLFFLYGEPDCAADLTRIILALDLSGSFMSRAGETFVALGLIHREPGFDNRRIVIFRLTDRGVAFCERIAEIFTAREEDVPNAIR